MSICISLFGVWLVVVASHKGQVELKIALGGRVVRLSLFVDIFLVIFEQEVVWIYCWYIRFLELNY